MLLPLPESALFHLDLLGESLPKDLFLFPELRVVHLFDLWFPELSGFHLGQSVCFVVVLFGGGDQVKHVCTNEKRAELFEVAVVLVLD